MSTEEQRAVARTLVNLRFDIANPDRNIRAQLDEPVEQIATADFYNGPVAEWVRRKTPFEWVPLRHEELDAVRTVRDLGKICFAHLAPKVPPLGELAEDVLGAAGGGDA